MTNLTRRTALGLGLSTAFIIGTGGSTFAADHIKIGFPANLTDVSDLQHHSPPTLGGDRGPPAAPGFAG